MFKLASEGERLQTLSTFFPLALCSPWTFASLSERFENIVCVANRNGIGWCWPEGDVFCLTKFNTNNWERSQTPLKFHRSMETVFRNRCGLFAEFEPTPGQTHQSIYKCVKWGCRHFTENPPDNTHRESLHAYEKNTAVFVLVFCVVHVTHVAFKKMLFTKKCSLWRSGMVKLYGLHSKKQIHQRCVFLSKTVILAHLANYPPASSSYACLCLSLFLSVSLPFMRGTVSEQILTFKAQYHDRLPWTLPSLLIAVSQPCRKRNGLGAKLGPLSVSQI